MTTTTYHQFDIIKLLLDSSKLPIIRADPEIYLWEPKTIMNRKLYAWKKFSTIFSMLIWLCLVLPRGALGDANEK